MNNIRDDDATLLCELIAVRIEGRRCLGIGKKRTRFGSGKTAMNILLTIDIPSESVRCMLPTDRWNKSCGF